MNSQRLIAILSTARNHGLTTYNHLQAFLHIGEKETCRTTDLVDVCQIVKPEVTQIADKLTALHLATRRHCKEDRRVIHIDITDKGRAAYLAITEATSQPLRSPKPPAPSGKPKRGRPLGSGKPKASLSHPAG